MFRKTSFLSLIIALPFSLALAQNAATPNIEFLQKHIRYLASDKLDGRRTGTTGANLAAEYIAREFARHGLRRGIGYDTQGMSILEADSPNRYLQKFPYIAAVGLGRKNELTFSTMQSPDASLTVGEDWMPLGLSSNARVEKSPAVLVGYGITAAELNYNDYANINATGKVAIAFEGTPDGANPHGRFFRFESVRWKAIAAKNAGARALIVIASETNFKDDSLSRLRYDNSAGDAGLPVIAVSRQAGERLLTANLSLLADIEKRLREQQPQVRADDQQAAVTTRPISITLEVDLVRRQVDAANVVGILDGSDSVLKKEAIVIGAHYDHLGRGGEGSLATKEGEIHHGADDNASGTAGLIELARLLAGARPGLRRTVVFVAFGGEEEGLLGSNYYVNHPVVPLANTVAMINMDMIGRMKDRKLIIGGVGTAQEWRPMIETANLLQGVTVTANANSRSATPSQNNYPLVVAANGRTIVSNDSAKQFQLTLNEDGFGPSDHSSFYSKQVPVLFFWTGTHDDYHKPSDTSDKINYTDEARVLDMISKLVRDLDAADKRPTFATAKVEPTGRATGFRVYLGTIPNYSDSSDGLLLDGVRDDSPAAKAGLKAGDKIVKLAGRDVRNVYDYTYALGEMKAGEEYEVEILRSVERLKLKITPAARR